MNNPVATRAIVIGSGVVSLGVINDLAADKVVVAHISPKSSDLALRSRWSAAQIVMDQDNDLDQQLMDHLNGLPREWDGACLLPTTDPLVRIVSKNLDTLKKRFVTPVIAWDSLLPIIDKAQLYDIASRAGIPTPQIIYGDSLQAVDDWIDTIRYPVIVKPSQTPEFYARFSVKALQADNQKELLDHLELVSKYGLDVMVSEIIPGEQSNLKTYRAYIRSNGEVLAEMCSEKVRSHPQEYGVGIVQKTIPMSDTLRSQGRTLLKTLNFTGFASMEFKFDHRDGQFKLIEINPRPAMIQRMFRKSGINFAKITVDDLSGLTMEKEYSYHSNVYSIHNTADLYHLKRHLRKGVGGLVQYFTPYLSRRKAFLVPPMRDPFAFYYAIKKVITGDR